MSTEAKSWTACLHCGLARPDLNLSDQAWEGIVRSGPSRAKAVGELVSLGEASGGDAEAFVDHLKSCIYSWRFNPDERTVLDRIDAAFAGVEKPEHFTNYQHCSECRDHDDTLRNRSRETITRDDLGNDSPLSFISNEGMAYYFPAFARLALGPDLWPSKDDFGAMLLWHLRYHGPANRFRGYCKPTQVAAIAAMIELMRSREPSYLKESPDLAEAAAVWSREPD